jgi:MFS family permease
MVGVGVGAPVGGILIDRAPHSVYPVGAALLGVAALSALLISPAAISGDAPSRSRYQWDRTRVASWMPLAYGFADRFLIGVFVSSFTLYLTEVHAVSAATRGMLMSLFLLPFAALCWPAGRLSDRVGWYAPIVTANILFGLVYASYGLLPFSLLPVAMVLSGVLSALMFSPSLVLVSEFARRGAGEGLFGVFQVAGSFGFLFGPIVGGLLVETLRTADGAPAWALIFGVVGALLVALGLISWRVLGRLAAEWATDAAPASRSPSR